MLKIIYISFLFLFVSTFAFAGKTPYSVVSVSNPEIKILSSNVFIWSESSRYVYNDERLGSLSLKDKLETDIKDKLAANGYVFSDNGCWICNCS